MADWVITGIEPLPAPQTGDCGQDRQAHAVRIAGARGRIARLRSRRIHAFDHGVVTP